MIVAVRLVRVVKMSFYQIIGVGTVRDGLVAAVLGVRMALIVAAAVVGRRAVLGVGCRYLDGVFVDVAVVDEVQVPLMEVVNVPGVFDLRMLAALAVVVAVPAMRLVFHAPSIPRSRYQLQT
jgi:hypothetical protein